MHASYHNERPARRRILIDLDAGTYALPDVAFDDLAALSRAARAALRAARTALALAVAGVAR